MRRTRKSQSGQALVLVAVALLALIGSAALVLLAGSAEWQRNQLQTLADSAALDSALQIGPTCTAGAASTVLTEADNFVATQRTRTGSFAIAAGTCATPYHGTDTFAGGLSADYYYPYQAHEQQVQVVLTLNLPISFGGEVGKTSTTLTRYAVAEALPASVPAVSATTISCTGGQVNVAGDIASQNAITLSGGCALYAHQRLSGGAYSSLGNATAYTDGQTWFGGGACIPGANAGSSNAICSDGYELSGHVTPTCGPGTTSYLSAANLVVNANPCAAGAGPQPVAPVSTALPPDPNTDANAVATLQGTGGAACTPGGVYPNILAGGVTVGTGMAPAPVKDASGFYHFKPSCYGYLNIGPTGSGGISNVQTGPVATETTHVITPILGLPSTAGTLLVATVRSDATPNKDTAQAGWVSAIAANQAGGGRSEIWYYPNNPGGISMASFTINPANIPVVAQMSEWRGAATVAPLDQTGTATPAGNQLTATVSTGAAMSVANELVITSDAFGPQAGQVFAPGAGWNSLANDVGDGFASEHRLDLGAVVASETASSTVATTWAISMATFKPGAAGGGGAVLDPGFYYFNGSGFAGGGGICLNGGTLLARDVTLEFVNQAGFSSGTCAAGGGANCGGTCQFGSTPCSISACPPNVAADSPNNLTWFASPCSSAPAGADAASCPGSAWCPVGDRSCWNELIWAPASNTGQVAVKGAAAHAWLLGSINWPGTMTYQANGTSTIAGAISCGTLSISAAGGAGTAVGGDYGISTATVEATLVE